MSFTRVTWPACCGKSTIGGRGATQKTSEPHKTDNTNIIRNIDPSILSFLYFILSVKKVVPKNNGVDTGADFSWERAGIAADIRYAFGPPCLVPKGDRCPMLGLHDSIHDDDPCEQRLLCTLEEAHPLPEVVLAA
jgi:hypothetical protein